MVFIYLTCFFRNMVSQSLIVDKSKHCNRLVLRNTSLFDEDIYHISLKIKPPNTSTFQNISIDSEWCSKIVTSDNLDIRCSSGSTIDCIGELPDGIYEIEYTLNENTSLYYHLRTCHLWNLYLEKSCSILSLKCNSSSDNLKKLKTLWELRNTILDAEILAEDCNNINEVILLYNYVEDKLTSNECMC